MQEEDDSKIDLGSISRLIPRCKDGDEDAKNELFDEMQVYLYNVARKNRDQSLTQKVGDSDIVQQSFMRAVASFDDFRGSTTNQLRGWLKMIVINEVKYARRTFRTAKRDVAREAKSSPTDSGEGFAPKTAVDRNMTPAANAMEAEFVEKLHSVMTELPEDYGRVIWLRHIDELSFAEIGEKMGRSENAATKLLRRAMKSFQELLLKSGHFENEKEEQK